MRKNCMAEVATALGLELEEVFRIDGDEHYFRLTDTGLGMSIGSDNKNWFAAPINALNGLLLGENEIIKLPWKPDDDEKYYVPDVTADRKYSTWRWNYAEVDWLHYKRGVVLKTAEEAIAVADEIISRCKERAKING